MTINKSKVSVIVISSSLLLAIIVIAAFVFIGSESEESVETINNQSQDDTDSQEEVIQDKDDTDSQREVIQDQDDSTSEMDDNSRTAASESVISEVTETLRLKCEAEQAAEHYATIYSVCELADLRFRIDDLSDASADQIQRFSDAMSIDCPYAPDGLPVIRNERMMISSYLVVEHTSVPDLADLYTQLVATDYQVELANICNEAPAGIRAGWTTPPLLSPLAGSSLADVVTALKTEIAGCMNQVFLIAPLGIVATACDNDLIDSGDDVLFADRANAEQMVLDNNMDALTFAYCGSTIKYKTIAVDADISIFSFDIETTNSVYESLIQQDAYEEAKLLDFCSS